ncbi:hypothetical protein SEUBUCD650_0D05050 [Saccharomyces eubayanus]|uniref:EF-hand domain-containing protein n=1 Tax=Saccharomyces eubayanus TaxID=1080349 RepID=A0ABN8VXR9_SACEU|nr:hypothetical protein SEUBUCD650_0D05050 [Saccharomyces eubayanus]
MEVFYNHLDPAEFRETMLRSFVFIDTSNCGLMKRTHFSSVLSTYPKSVSKERRTRSEHSDRDWRPCGDTSLFPRTIARWR